MKLKISLEKLDETAHAHGWARIDYQPNIGMASYGKTTEDGPARINVYMTTMTVTTVVNHPIKGRNSMYRKKVDRKRGLLDRIFQNPREHTPIGYRKREHAR